MSARHVFMKAYDDATSGGGGPSGAATLRQMFIAFHVQGFPDAPPDEVRVYFGALANLDDGLVSHVDLEALAREKLRPRGCQDLPFELLDGSMASHNVGIEATLFQRRLDALISFYDGEERRKGSDLRYPASSASSQVKRESQEMFSRGIIMPEEGAERGGTSSSKGNMSSGMPAPVGSSEHVPWVVIVKLLKRMHPAAPMQAAPPAATRSSPPLTSAALQALQQASPMEPALSRGALMPPSVAPIVASRPPPPVNDRMDSAMLVEALRTSIADLTAGLPSGQWALRAYVINIVSKADGRVVDIDLMQLPNGTPANGTVTSLSSARRPQYITAVCFDSHVNSVILSQIHNGCDVLIEKCTTKLKNPSDVKFQRNDHACKVILDAHSTISVITRLSATDLERMMVAAAQGVVVMPTSIVSTLNAMGGQIGGSTTGSGSSSSLPAAVPTGPQVLRGVELTSAVPKALMPPRTGLAPVPSNNTSNYPSYPSSSSASSISAGILPSNAWSGSSGSSAAGATPSVSLSRPAPKRTLFRPSTAPLADPEPLVVKAVTRDDVERRDACLAVTVATTMLEEHQAKVAEQTSLVRGGNSTAASSTVSAPKGPRVVPPHLRICALCGVDTESEESLRKLQQRIQKHLGGTPVDAVTTVDGSQAAKRLGVTKPLTPSQARKVFRDPRKASPTYNHVLCQHVFYHPVHQRHFVVHHRCAHLATWYQEGRRMDVCVDTKNRCTLCGEGWQSGGQDAAGGACVKCYHPQCQKWFHTSCALLSPTKFVNFSKRDPYHPVPACPTHTEFRAMQKPPSSKAPPPPVVPAVSTKRPREEDGGNDSADDDDLLLSMAKDVVSPARIRDAAADQRIETRWEVSRPSSSSDDDDVSSDDDQCVFDANKVSLSSIRDPDAEEER